MPYLERSDAASIIAISSVSGRESDFASGPYGTAKTALVGYILYDQRGKTRKHRLHKLVDIHHMKANDPHNSPSPPNVRQGRSGDGPMKQRARPPSC